MNVSRGDSFIERKWSMCDKFIPKEELIYLTQVFLIYLVVIVCVINLSFGDPGQAALWSSLLSGALGYLLPAPSVSSNKDEERNESVLPNST